MVPVQSFSSNSYLDDWREQLTNAYVWREVSILCRAKAPIYEDDWNEMKLTYDKRIIIWQRMIMDELRDASAPEELATLWFKQLENFAQIRAPDRVKKMECDQDDIAFVGKQMIADSIFLPTLDMVVEEGENT